MSGQCITIVCIGNLFLYVSASLTFGRFTQRGPMPTRKRRVRHAEIVTVFAGRLRTLRVSRGMTQAELARQAHVTTSYIWRLENGSSAPGIDLVERLANALGTTAGDLISSGDKPDTFAALKSQAERLFAAFTHSADQEDLLMLNPLLARLVRSR